MVHDNTAAVDAVLQAFDAAPQVIAFPGAAPQWSYATVSGRLCEISATYGVGLASAAAALVRDAQIDGEPVAWITTGDVFYAADMAACGIDLQGLAVVRLEDTQSAARAADRLMRSGAFGLIVLDIGDAARIPMPLQGRLVQLAGMHSCALVCLTHKPVMQESIGSMVSLHAQVEVQLFHSHVRLCIDVHKDKHFGPGWHTEFVLAASV